MDKEKFIKLQKKIAKAGLIINEAIIENKN